MYTNANPCPDVHRTDQVTETCLSRLGIALGVASRSHIDSCEAHPQVVKWGAWDDYRLIDASPYSEQNMRELFSPYA